MRVCGGVGGGGGGGGLNEVDDEVYSMERGGGAGRAIKGTLVFVTM